MKPCRRKRCVHPAAPGCVSCEYHLAIVRRSALKQRARRAGSGMCLMFGCASLVGEGHAYCEDCRAYRRLKYAAAKEIAA